MVPPCSATCLHARSFTVSCGNSARISGQTKIAGVFVESSWTTLQKLRWFEMGETVLIHVSARVDQPEHELGRRCGCGKT